MADLMAINAKMQIEFYVLLAILHLA